MPVLVGTFKGGFFMGITLLYLVVGVCVGSVVTFLINGLLNNAQKKRECVRIEERDQAIRSIAEISADIDTLVTSFRSGALKEAAFKSSLVSKVEDLSRNFKVNTHLFDVFYIKYIEILSDKYNQMITGIVTPFQFAENGGFASETIEDTPLEKSVAEISAPAAMEPVAKPDIVAKPAAVVVKPAKIAKPAAVVVKPDSVAKSAVIDNPNTRLDKEISTAKIDTPVKKTTITNDVLDVVHPVIETRKVSDVVVNKDDEDEFDLSAMIPADSKKRDTIIFTENKNTNDVKKEKKIESPSSAGISATTAKPALPPAVSEKEVIEEPADEFSIELDFTAKKADLPPAGVSPVPVSSNVKPNQAVPAFNPAEGENTDVADIDTFEKQFELATKGTDEEDFAMETIMDLDMGRFMRSAMPVEDSESAPAKSSPFGKIPDTMRIKADTAQFNFSNGQIIAKPEENLLTGKKAGQFAADKAKSVAPADFDIVVSDENKDDGVITGDDVASKIDSMFKI
jgi:hypothetical protein